ncbi:hypothetical protein [[Mycobacterium] nativiensis]|uniref:Uncharacterized protein n=1 Tax=[Mycobacterium] nativiensis TaxID=2855503 RepID=A0ABU5Y174_9MYCO|nr:hypothetical protein [Mycolicibacter sp. MYC340]MEB3033787.1 hypothetical protein [Mycolicibacter sp. MYC340]
MLVLIVWSAALGLEPSYSWAGGIPVAVASLVLLVVRPALWRLWCAAIGWALVSQACIDTLGWAGIAVALLAGAVLCRRLLLLAHP